MSKKVKTLKEIRTILENLKPELVKKYKIKEIGVFGSWVRGEQKKNSDIDILVEFEENAGISLFDFIEIEDYLRKKVGIKVDLVEKKALKPYIGKNILREVIYL
ncbi:MULTISPECIES: nucleotidyltransferase family protein [Thermodesulfovibrio]|uniref:Nucleotidyltransferase n=1 Tax=Thermodesulfovibrio yellowstonii (strain ATCC 51303 / DSM 11347 / YP87) TaxID=289376 RepID=B5YL89_THEYD|nr:MULTISPECIES: nucleotidyltransferase [Thermodesulfovibrio]ACI21912.1 nucleotidyltransferase [Thermodesulfovibrio yellowstonii DSM 11347]MDI6864058.1 nucleotidyltransferase [Thermodesulfovibrio yellowstonii]